MRTELEDQLQRQIEGDTVQGPVVKAMKAPSVPSLDEGDGHLAAGHAENRGWCPFCVAGKEKVRLIDGWRRCVTMGIQNSIWITPFWAEKRVTERRQFSKDCWLITHLVPCKCAPHRWIVGMLVNDAIMSGVQTLVVKSGQEVSIVDVKNSLMRELRGVVGLTVVPEESPVGGSAASAVIERSVWELQSTTRANVACAEWVHHTLFEPGSGISAWTVEFSGQVVIRFRRSVSDGKTAKPPPSACSVR